MPRAMLKHLPAKASALWEEVYAASKKKGRPDDRAAAEAWSAVKKGWHKGKDEKWVKSMSMIFAQANQESLTQSGNLFRKALITVGEWVNPNDTKESYPITPDRIEQWIENFEAKRPALVTVPIGHEGYSNALMNTGYVRDLEFDGTTLYGMIEFTDPDAAKLAQEGSIPAVSIAVYDDYFDTQSGASYGEAIYHVALTHAPWIDGMDGFQALGIVVDASSVRLLSKSTKTGEKDPSVPQVTPEYAELSVLNFRSAVENGEYTSEELRSLALQISNSYHEATGHDVGVRTLVAKYAKEDDHMTEEEKAKLDQLGKDKIELEAKLAKETEEKNKLLSQNLEERVGQLRKRVSNALEGKTPGSKFGIPGEHTGVKLMSLITSLTEAKTVQFELKAGEKTEKRPDEVLVELIEEIVKTGTIQLERKTKPDDTKPSDGESEDGKGFAERQMARKDIKIPGQKEKD